MAESINIFTNNRTGGHAYLSNYDNETELVEVKHYYFAYTQFLRGTNIETLNSYQLRTLYIYHYTSTQPSPLSFTDFVVPQLDLKFFHIDHCF